MRCTDASGNVGSHDARTTQSDQDANNDMSYDDVGAIARQGTDRRRERLQGQHIWLVR